MSDALISARIIQDVLDERDSQVKQTDFLQDLQLREPVLASYVAQNLLSICGKLSLSGAPPEIVRGCHDDLLEAISVSVRAVWRGYDELWKGTDLNKMLNHREIVSTPSARKKLPRDRSRLDRSMERSKKRCK